MCLRKPKRAPVRAASFVHSTCFTCHGPKPLRRKSWGCAACDRRSKRAADRVDRLRAALRAASAA